MPFCVFIRMVLKKRLWENSLTTNQTHNPNTYCPPLSTRVWHRYFLAFLWVGQFSKATSKSPMALFRLPLVAYLEQQSCIWNSDASLSQKWKKVKQADLQSSTCYQSFNILGINFQSLVVLIHGFHMAPNLKIIHPSLYTGEKIVRK